MGFAPGPICSGALAFTKVANRRGESTRTDDRQSFSLKPLGKSAPTYFTGFRLKFYGFKLDGLQPARSETF